MSFTSILTIAVIVVVFIVLFKVFKLLMRLLLVVVFLLLAFVTNPDVEKHKAAVHEKARKNAIVLIGKRIKVEDYYVFSLTYIQQINDKKIIGAGAFTQVLIFRNP